MKKLVFGLIAGLTLSFAASLPAWADASNDVGNCAIGGLIAGGVAQMTGSRNVGGAAAVGCGGGTLLGRSVNQNPPPPPPDYRYEQPRRQQPPVYIYQDQQRPVEVYVPPACEKHSYDQDKLNRCISVFEQEQLRLANEARRAAEVRRQAEMRQVEEEARQAARSGGY